MNYGPPPEFDEKDRELLKVRMDKRKARQEESGQPEVGDFILVPCEGTDELETLRFTHEWGDGLQTTCRKGHPCSNDQSFYIDRDGECSFSGSLDRSLERSKIKKSEFTSVDGKKEVLIQDLKYGNVWFFHHDWPGAGCGVYTRAEFRVWRYTP
jgi:hypothetical protein